MNLNERFPIIIKKHPSYEFLNILLIEDIGKIDDWDLSYKTNVNGKMSPWRTKTTNVDVVIKWVRDTLYEKYSWLAQNHKFIDIESWFAVYNKGDFTARHDHYMSEFSWVYFVKSPRGSSPLVFSTSGKRIKAEEGRVVIFPGCLKHEVPKNKCCDRIVLAGNVNVDQGGIYRENEEL